MTTHTLGWTDDSGSQLFAIGWLEEAIQEILDEFFGAGDNDRFAEDELILAIIKAFVQRAL